jgi:CrcB protein
VALGSAVGGVARYLLGLMVQRHVGGAFPLGTMLINIAGSFLAGFLIRYALATPGIPAEARALLATGFCGGFTTFSAFTYETLTLAEAGEFRLAAWYVAGSVVVALAGAFLGVSAARELLALRARI